MIQLLIKIYNNNKNRYQNCTVLLFDIEHPIPIGANEFCSCKELKWKVIHGNEPYDRNEKGLAFLLALMVFSMQSSKVVRSPRFSGLST